MVSSLLMLYSGGAREVCTRIFHHIWYSLNTLLMWGVEHCHGFALLVHLDDGHPSTPTLRPCPKAGMGPFLITGSSYKLVGEQQKKKPKIKNHTKQWFLSSEKFQHFEMWFGANLTKKSKLSANDFGVMTSKDVSKYQIRHKHGIKQNSI